MAIFTNRERRKTMIRKILFLFLIGLLVVSCFSSDDFALNQSFTIGYHHTMVNPNEELSITFVDVIDGRCPYFFDCSLPMASEAVVRIDVTFEDMVETIELGMAIEPSTVAAFGYSFTLLDLSPPQFHGRRRDRQSVNMRAYEAELKVTHYDCSGPDC